MSWNRIAALGGKKLRAVTPDDDNDLPDGPCRALWVGTIGNISVILDGDTSAVVLKNVNELLPFEVRRVLSTNTTADDIVAVYGR